MIWSKIMVGLYGVTKSMRNKKILMKAKKNLKIYYILLTIPAIYMTITGHTDSSSFVFSLILWLLFFFLPPIIFYNIFKSEKIFKIISLIILVLWFLVYPLTDFILT